MVKKEKLKNLDWKKIKDLVTNELITKKEKIKINQTMGEIKKSNGKKLSFGGFDEFWSCNVDSKSCYLHIQVDYTKFIETQSNNIYIYINFWGMNGKKITLEVNIDKIISRKTLKSQLDF
jgi:hypothetical protein